MFKPAPVYPRSYVALPGPVPLTQQPSHVAYRHTQPSCLPTTASIAQSEESHAYEHRRLLPLFATIQTGTTECANGNFLDLYNTEGLPWVRGVDCTISTGVYCNTPCISTGLLSYHPQSASITACESLAWSRSMPCSAGGIPSK